jgi:hypothetical protein
MLDISSLTGDMRDEKSAQECDDSEEAYAGNQE